MQDKINSLSSGYLEKNERDDVQKQLYGTNFKTSLKVFQDHNGFINGELHTFIGTKGSGKSTWSKTIISDLVYDDKKLFLYISEERKNKYLKSLNDNFFLILKDEEKVQKALSNIVCISELEVDFKSANECLQFLKNICREGEIDILIFDNFTTSFMSEQSVKMQSETLRKFNFLADSLNIPVILFFHTSKLFDSKRLDGDNVRGSATAVNIGSYNYIIAQHKDGSNLRNFIFTEKARYHSTANKRMYELTFDPRVNVFTKCEDYYLEDYHSLIGGKKKSTKGFG